ncbi:hypothetical protein BVC93_18305 [Mycobacterium sp. MS1601]|uniref:hypothetical protein n=1 Tax=Mycobacterium sp. MS1601 TaxID=1936029 RepID=UPI00097922E9|nr:hypothetical protein [Mycobacterium sp. MS1601]AQA04056.1 hypothetical protein BVC93_18305 [Mycobacterium sp. MS1601]
MTVYMALTIAVIVVLATTATLAIYLGLLNWMGTFYVVRCGACHHLTFAGADHTQPSCPHCRHPVLMHPLHSAHHPRSISEVRVVGDQLRY